MADHLLYATLIGINAYSQNPLSGCIKDVLDIDLVLRECCRQQEGNLIYDPLYFLAPNEIDKFRIEDYNTAIKTNLEYAPPSFKNLTGPAFEHLKKAKDGDTCLFYYSGHGSQINAPEVFWHTKPDRQNETIVCVDSRDKDSPGSRDLIDKELGFLIWDTLKGKNVHCLVIMDCCHSGNNTRAVENHDLAYRYVSSSGNNIPLEQYLGFGNSDFYEMADGQANMKIGRYVHLAAARDSEKAQETKNGGLFTGKLVELLKAGGTAKSYRDLVQSLLVTIRNRTAQQNPVAFALIEDDLDLNFLGKSLLPYRPIFDLRYDFGRKQWLLYGGAMHGLVATGRHARTLIQIPGFEQDIAVVEVFATISILDQDTTTGLDKNRNDYKAVLKQLANPLIKIGISAGLLAEPELEKQLQEAYEHEPHLYFEIDFDIGLKAPDYLIHLTNDNEFVLTRNNSDIPVFKREHDALSFLRNVDAVGKWVSTSELKNTNPSYSNRDFVFTLEKIEGQAITPENLDKLKGEVSTIQPGAEILLSYKNGELPAFRLNISIDPESSLQSCFAGALYLESRFAIKNEFIPADSNRLVKEGSPVNLSVGILNRIYNTLPVQLDPKYRLYNINEITAILKIFVAGLPPDLHRFKQPNLELEDKPNIKLRGDDITMARDHDNLGDQTNWTVFTFRISVAGPAKAKLLDEGTPNDFSAFTVKVPAGFQAAAFAVSGDDLVRTLQISGSRGLVNEKIGVPSLLKPSASIWGNIISDDSPFSKGLSAVSDNGIRAIELIPIQTGQSLELAPGEEIRIIPKEPSLITTSEDDLEDTIIPFGFDEASQLFFPVGNSDEAGNIHIKQLPPVTTGTFQTGEHPSRSTEGSIKIFFKKIFRKKQGNSLVLYGPGINGSWEELSNKPEVMKLILAGKTGGNVLMLTHGFTGSTIHMMACIEAIPGISELADFILTFDYENLNTPIPKTAAGLDNDLRKAGFSESGMPGIIFIAHSLGGLVARWLVEKEGGRDYINKLILVGVPSGGLEPAKSVNAVFGMFTHALNATGSIKNEITGLAFLLKKLESSPGKIFKDLTPGSDFLTKLGNAAPPEGVQYYVIAGNVVLVENGYDGDDYFLKMVTKALVKKEFYHGLSPALDRVEPNDMVVALESMKSISGLDNDEQIQVVPCNHLAYFQEKLSRNAIADFLKDPGKIPVI